MTCGFTRRGMLKLGAAASMMSAMPAFAQDRRLRVFWWGGQDRADRTNRAIEAFTANEPGLSVDGEYTDFGNYVTRLATQVAGGNAPDLIQMDYRYITEFAQRGSLEPLDGYIGSIFDFSDWEQASTDSCRVDGKLYAINLGNNTNAMFFDIEGYAKAGITEIPFGTSWPDFFDMAASVTQAHNGTYYGTTDASGQGNALENWIRQKGKNMYSGNQPGGTPDDYAEWFSMWGDARAASSCPPADIQAMGGDGPDDNLLALNYAAVTFSHSNNLVASQGATPKKLAMTLYPQGAGPNHGNYLKPSQMWSVSSTSTLKDDAAKLAWFTVMDPKGVEAFGVERGVPASTAMRDVLSGIVDDVDKIGIDYLGKVGNGFVGTIPPPPPRGAAEFEAKLKEISETVAFGSITAEQGGKALFDEGKAILSRA